jgi:hypothetical protein
VSGDERVVPRGSYQEALEHSLALATLLEHAVMFLPNGCDLWHRSSVELSQYSEWIDTKLNQWN